MCWRWNAEAPLIPVGLIDTTEPLRYTPHYTRSNLRRALAVLLSLYQVVDLVSVESSRLVVQDTFYHALCRRVETCTTAKAEWVSRAGVEQQSGHPYEQAAAIGPKEAFGGRHRSRSRSFFTPAKNNEGRPNPVLGFERA